MKRPTGRRATGSKPPAKPTSPAKKAAKPGAAAKAPPSKGRGAAKPSAAKARPKAPPGTLLPPDKRTLALLGKGVSGSDYHGKIRGKAQGCDGTPALFVGGEVVSVGRVRGAIRREEIAAGLRPAPVRRPRSPKVVDATGAAVEVVGAGLSGARAVAPVKRESFGAGTPDAPRAKAPAAALVKRESFGAGTPDAPRAARAMDSWGPATVRVLERFQRPRELVTSDRVQAFRVVQDLVDDYGEIANDGLPVSISGANDGSGTCKGRAYANKYEFAEAVAKEIEGRLHRPVPGDAAPLLARVSKLLGIDRRQGFTMDRRQGRDRVWEEGDWHKAVRQLFARFGEVTGNAYDFNGVAMTRAEAEREEPMSSLIGRLRERTVITGEPSMLPGVSGLMLRKYNGGHAIVGGRQVLLAGRNEWAHFVLSAMERALKLAPAAKGADFRRQFGGGSVEPGRPRPPQAAPRGESWASMVATHGLQRAMTERRTVIRGMFELFDVSNRLNPVKREGPRLSRESAEQFVEAAERHFRNRPRNEVGRVAPRPGDYVVGSVGFDGTVYGQVVDSGGKLRVLTSDAEPVFFRAKPSYPLGKQWSLTNDPSLMRAALNADTDSMKSQERDKALVAKRAAVYAGSYAAALAAGEVPLTPELARPGMIVHAHYTDDQGLAKPMAMRVERVEGGKVYVTNNRLPGAPSSPPRVLPNVMGTGDDHAIYGAGANPARWMETLYTAVVSDGHAARQPQSSQPTGSIVALAGTHVLSVAMQSDGATPRPGLFDLRPVATPLVMRAYTTATRAQAVEFVEAAERLAAGRPKRSDGTLKPRDGDTVERHMANGAHLVGEVSRSKIRLTALRGASSRELSEDHPIDDAWSVVGDPLVMRRILDAAPVALVKRESFGAGTPDAARAKPAPVALVKRESFGPGSADAGRERVPSRVEEFVAGLPPMQAARARAALEKPITVNGANPRAKHLHVARLVAAGSRVEPPSKGENAILGRRLVNPDGAWLVEQQLGKTAMDYAAFLAASQPAPRGLGYGAGTPDAARPRKVSDDWVELARTHNVTSHARLDVSGHHVREPGKFDLYLRADAARTPIRVLDRAEALRFLAAAEAAFAGRAKYANGALVPVVGDKVSQVQRGFGGTGAAILGEVFLAAGKPRVRITGVASVLGIGSTKAKTAAVDASWNVVGDPRNLRELLSKDVGYQQTVDRMRASYAHRAARYATSYDTAIAAGEVPLTLDVARPGMMIHDHSVPQVGSTAPVREKLYRITRVEGGKVYAINDAQEFSPPREFALYNDEVYDKREDSQIIYRGAPHALWMPTLYTAIVASARPVFRDPPAPEEPRAGTTLEDRKESQRWLRNEARNLHTEINARVSTAPYLALLREVGHIGNELDATVHGVASSSKLATAKRALARLRDEAAAEGRRISIDPARQSFEGPLVRPDTGSLRSLVTDADRYAALLPIISEAGRIYEKLYAAEQSTVGGGGASKAAREALSAIAQSQHLYSPTRGPEVDFLIDLWADLVRASVMADTAADALKRTRPAQGTALVTALGLLGLGDRDIPEYHNMRAWFALYADMLRGFAHRVAMQVTGAPITVIDTTRKSARHSSFAIKPGSAIVGVKEIRSSPDKPGEQVVLFVMRDEYTPVAEQPAGAQWVADQIAQRILAWHRGVAAKPSDPGVIDRVAALSSARKPPVSANTEQAAAYLQHLVHAASEAVCYADGPRGGAPCGKRQYSHLRPFPEPNANGRGVRVVVDGPRAHSQMAEVWLWEDGTADVIEGGNRSPLAATQARTRHPSYASAIADIAARFEPMLTSSRKLRFGMGDADPMRPSLTNFDVELSASEAALLRRVVAVGAPLGGSLAFHFERGSRWVRAECNLSDRHGIMVVLEAKTAALQSAHFYVGVNSERMGWLRDAAPLQFRFKAGLASFMWGETRIDENKLDPKLRPMAHLTTPTAAWLELPAAAVPVVFKRLSPLAAKDESGEHVALGVTPGGVKAVASNGISAVILDVPGASGRQPGKDAAGVDIAPEVVLSEHMQAAVALVADLLGPSGRVAVDTEGQRHYFRAPRVVAWVSAGKSLWREGRATVGQITKMVTGFQPGARREVRVPLKGLLAAFPVVRRLGPETCVTFADGRLYADKHGNIVDVKLPVAMGPNAGPVAFIPETLEPVLRTLFPKAAPDTVVELHGTPDVDDAPGARFVPAPDALGLVMPCSKKATSAVPSAAPGMAKSSDVSVLIPNDATGPLETMFAALGAPKGWMMHLSRVSLGTLRVTAGAKDGAFVADVPATFEGLWPSGSRVGVPGEAIAKVLRGKRDTGGVRISLIVPIGGKGSDVADIRVSGRGLTLTGNAAPNDNLATQLLGELASTGHVVASMTGAQAVDVFGAAEPSMSHDDTRPHLSAAFLNGVAVVATDGHRLFVAPYAKGGATMAGLLPARAVRLMLSVLGPKGAGRSVKITAAVHPSALGGNTAGRDRKPGAFVIELGDLTLRSAAVDAEFPSYQQIIPAASSGALIVDREALVTFAAAMAKKYRNSRTQPIHFEADGRLVCTAGVGDGEPPTVAPFKAKVTGAEVRIGFNANYLADAAAGMRGKTISIQHAGELDPVLIEENGRLAVVMPMRI